MHYLCNYADNPDSSFAYVDLYHKATAQFLKGKATFRAKAS